MKFIYRGNKVFQYFIVVDTKMKKFVLQNQYSLNLKFEEIIEQHALSLGDDRFTFVSRRDEDDRVSLEFSVTLLMMLFEKRPSYFYNRWEITSPAGESVNLEMKCSARKSKKILGVLQSCKFSSENDEGKKNK